MLHRPTNAENTRETRCTRLIAKVKNQRNIVSLEFSSNSGDIEINEMR